MPEVERGAIVISGGTARGAYAAGLLRGLCRRFPALRERVSILSGTSTGALLAPLVSLWIAEPERGDEVLDRMTALYEVDAREVFRAEPERLWLRALVRVLGIFRLPVEQRNAAAMLLEGGTVLDTSPLRRIIGRECTDELVARLIARRDRVECIVNCVSAQRGELVTFSTRDPRMTPALFRDAVYASCLQPLFMPLHRISSEGRGEEYMDGGIRDIVPAWAAFRAGATRMLAIALFQDGTGGRAYEAGPFGGRDRLFSLFERVVVDLLDGEVEGDDVLQARYLATIGRLLRLAEASGASDDAIAEATEMLTAEEREELEGSATFTDLFVHRPPPDLRLIEDFAWTSERMRASIEAGERVAAGAEGERIGRFFERAPYAPPMRRTPRESGIAPRAPASAPPDAPTSAGDLPSG